MINYDEIVGRIVHAEGMVMEVVGYDARKPHVLIMCRDVDSNDVKFISDTDIEKVEPKPLVSVFSGS